LRTLRASHFAGAQRVRAPTQSISVSSGAHRSRLIRIDPMADRHFDQPRSSSAVATPPHEAAALADEVRYTSIWRNRHFLLLWLAQAISQTAQNAIWYGI